jgi:hypothetical protein
MAGAQTRLDDESLTGRLWLSTATVQMLSPEAHAPRPR